MPLARKICLLGDFAVGKTSLVRRYVEQQFDDNYLTTVGVKLDTKQVEIPGSRPVKLVIWDMAGASELTEIKTNYLDGASGYILVYDLSRPQTLDSAVRINQQARDKLGDVPCVLVGNKSDLVVDAIHRTAEIPDASHTLQTSALTGDGVDEAFEFLARHVSEPLT